MENNLTGEQVQSDDEVIDVFTCCGRRVHETPQGVFDDETEQRHEHQMRVPECFD